MKRSASAADVVSRLRPFVASVVSSVLEAAAETPVALRRDAFKGTPSEPQIAAYVEKVRRRAYRVEQQEVDALIASGLTEAAIFEITVAAALGEGMRRLELGIRLLVQRE